VNRTLKALIITILFVIAIICVLLALTLSYKDKIIDKFKYYFNNSIKTEIRIKRIELDLLRKFPKISINLKDVYVKSNLESKEDTNILNDTLIFAKNILIELDIKSLLKKNIVYSKIYFYNSIINIIINENKYKSYDIFFTSSDTNKNFNLPKYIIVKSTIINYKNLKDKLSIKTDVDKLLILLPDNNLKNIIIKTYGFLDNLDTYNFLSIKNSNFNLNLRINNNLNEIKILDGKFEINKLKFNNIKGDIGQNKINILIESQKLDYSLFTRTFNFKNFRIIDHYNHIKWNFSLNTRIKIEKSLNNDVLLKINFLCNKGFIKNSLINQQFDKVLFSGDFIFRNKKGSNSFLVNLNNLQLEYDKNYLYGSLKLNTNNSKSLYSDLNFFVKADDIANFFKIDSIKFRGEVEGKIKILTNSFNLKNDFLNYIKDAKLDFNDFAINIVGKKYFINNIEKINGEITINELLNFKNLNISYLNNIIVLNGNINYPELNTGEIDIKSDNININDLSDVNTSFSSKKNDKQNIKLNFDIKNFTFKNFKAENIRGNVKIGNSFIDVKIDRFTAFEGNNILESTIKNYDRGYEVKGRLHMNKTKIKSLFKTFNNFGQKSLTYQNIDGNFTGNILFYFLIENNGTIDLNSLNINSYIEITDGNLKDYAPMMFLSKYIDVEELKDIRFKKLKNNILVENKKIVIPEMDIISSAFKLRGSGFHTFDNKYEYNLIIDMNEFLGKKVKKKNRELENIYEQEENKGVIRIPLKITGKDTTYKVIIEKSKLIKINLKSEYKNEPENVIIENNKLNINEFNNEDKKDKQNQKINEEEKKSNIKFEWE